MQQPDPLVRNGRFGVGGRLVLKFRSGTGTIYALLDCDGLVPGKADQDQRHKDGPYSARFYTMVDKLKSDFFKMAPMALDLVWTSFWSTHVKYFEVFIGISFTGDCLKLPIQCFLQNNENLKILHLPQLLRNSGLF